MTSRTPVATPTGAWPIGSLAVGDTVLAYNPTTGKSEPEPVQHVWRNHDHDLVDVQLTTTATATATTTTTTAADTVDPTSAGNADQATQRNGAAAATTANARLHRWVRQGILAAGLAATLLTASGGTTAQAAAPTSACCR